MLRFYLKTLIFFLKSSWKITTVIMVVGAQGAVAREGAAGQAVSPTALRTSGPALQQQLMGVDGLSWFVWAFLALSYQAGP